MEEIWKNIKDFPSYQISNMGNVKRIVSGQGAVAGRILKPEILHDGYHRITLSDNGKKDRKRINRLVLEIFNPVNDMDNLESNHKDGNKNNNKLDNLEWMTNSENRKHAYENNLINNFGENNGATNLTDNKVKIIKQILKSPIIKQLKITQKEIAEIFGISETIISRIKLGKTWAYIEI